MPGKSDDEELSGSEEEEVSGSESGSGEEEEEEEEEDEEENVKPPKEKKPSSKEKSADDVKERVLQNQPFDAAVDVSDSESVTDAQSPKKEGGKTLKNQPFDEALELSGSVNDLDLPSKDAAPKKEIKELDKVEEKKAITDKGAAPSSTAAPKKTTKEPEKGEVKNKPFDEEVNLSDSEASVDTAGAPSPEKPKMEKRLSVNQTLTTMPKAAADKAAVAVEDKKPQPAKDAKPNAASSSKSQSSKESKASSSSAKKKKKHESSSEGSDDEDDEEDDEEDEEEDEEDDDEEEEAAANAASTGGATAGGSATGGSGMGVVPGAYKESDFAHLKVSQDIRELFQYIGRFKSQDIELETRLKCFVPEYIPAIGDMDTFLKIPRPDNEPDYLGLKVLDEPSIAQSDATVLDLQLRATSKKKHGDIVVRSIENAEKNVKEIDRWIKSISDLHRTKPPPQVHYTKTMPDIETLMQVWPEEFEELLSKTQLPHADLDVTVDQYTRVICAILDIPVYKNVYESLHVLFTLYLEFRSNQHFMNYEVDNAATSSVDALAINGVGNRSPLTGESK
ncbi:hypothetical protein H310_13135 [Aphanomyces invadans]|uniref:Intraflagellar transport protein 46 homolog n=1 Tax=Aphanomyces invadans TaxID=157072 RepID=A0A024TGI1_9STRA|nr:hypothetical protein H310_13135 [Aphanomyces invadans]ETV92701.1 hypothetical protein H310_13135 [Aphanomyces invadans]|eukprot:XP_008878737.1 hypothetical protein H310_13135 [Aphanomyces invadans]